LFVQWIGISGVAVLESRRFQEANGGNPVGFYDRVKVVDVIVMIRLAIVADLGNVLRPRMIWIRGGSPILEEGVVRDVVSGARGSRRRNAKGGLLQPAMPLSPLIVRSKPPMNDPQLTPAELSKSPMFLLAIWTWLRVGAEHTSPTGSGSPTTDKVPLPPSVSLEEGALRFCTRPFVCQATKFIKPGVEGPNIVS